MNHDDMARLLPAERDLPAARKQILKEHLMTELRQADDPATGSPAEPRTKAPAQSPHGPRRGGRPHGGGGGHSDRRRRGDAHQPARRIGQPAQPAHAATAAQLLAKIAAAAARQPAPVVRDSDFMYIRSEVAYEVDSISNGHETASMEKPHERQIWLPVAEHMRHRPAHRERRAHADLAVPGRERQGRPPPAQGTPLPNFTCPSEGHLGDTTYRLLQSIPTQPDALLAYLKAGKKWTNDDPPTEIGDMIRETIMPPALAAALYRLAATLPGATLVPHATNAAGRAGIGIMWTSTTAKQVYKNEWIFDKTTLQFIGERIFNPETGQVTGESAILQQAFTAKAGQRP